MNFDDFGMHENDLSISNAGLLLAQTVSKVGMVRDLAEKTLSDATQRHLPTALAVQLIGQFVEALLKTVEVDWRFGGDN